MKLCIIGIHNWTKNLEDTRDNDEFYCKYCKKILKVFK